MAQTPSGPPGGRKSHGPPIGEDYGDFEGDPTSINQIPQPGSGPPPMPQQQRGSLPPGQFPQGSPHLSHVGPQQFSQQPQPPQQMMTQVSGIIAQPTPYVARSRIYAFVVDETGMPIEL